MSEKTERTYSSESVASSFGSCRTIVSFSSSDSLCEYDNDLQDIKKNKKVEKVIQPKNEVIAKRRQREKMTVSNSPQIKDILHLLALRGQSPFSSLSKETKK
tara:strand:- start:111 stop:416 length:306 start_codon:yes stop_codon:yes gene_type:complete